MSVDKAVQIMAADPGWGAALARFDFDEGVHLWAEPLCGWSITKDSGGDSTVAGLVVHPDYPTSVIACYEVRAETRESDAPVTFLGYLRPGQSVEEHREDAEAAYRRWREEEAQDRELFDAGWSMHLNNSYRTRWEAPDGRLMSKRDALQELQGASESPG